MRVLVLGATGGTGREIVRQAGAKGHSVVALVRSKARAHDLVGATLVEGDARDQAALAAHSMAVRASSARSAPPWARFAR